MHPHAPARRAAHCASALAAPLFLALCAGAALPTYDAMQVQCRANFAGAYNLPNSTFFTNGTPSINSDGAVAIKLDVITQSFRGAPLQQGAWAGADAKGGVIYEAPSDALVGDVSLNDAGLLVCTQSFSPPIGVIRVDTKTGAFSTGVGPGGMFGVTGFGTALINESGVIGFRGQVAGSPQAFISDLAGSQARHVAEVGADPSSPYSFLFTPAMNNNRQMAGKARLGSSGQVGETQPDQIRLWNADGSSTLIAQDVDSSAGAPFTRFDNSVGVNDAGWVAFNATLPGGARGVFLSNGATTLEIASTAVGAPRRIMEVEFFRPDVNNANVVVFRGRDLAGVQSVFVGDGSTLLRLAGRGTPIPTDLGAGQINQHDSSPVFGGGPTINDAGDVAFNCGLTPIGNTQIEWGSGVVVYKAVRGSPADLNGDGVVNAADLAMLLGSWGPCAACPADLDGDGVVTSADLAALLGSWG